MLLELKMLLGEEALINLMIESINMVYNLHLGKVMFSLEKERSSLLKIYSLYISVVESTF